MPSKLGTSEFELFLDILVTKLQVEAQIEPFATASEFENRLRVLINKIGGFDGTSVTLKPHPHAFPDISLGTFGIEVKHTQKDTWRSVANSILESSRDVNVEQIYVVFGKMGGTPEVKWQLYENAIIHVRTSHVPRFELEIGSDRSLFTDIGISYELFKDLTIEEKMVHIRSYAKGRLKEGQRLWWLGDQDNSLDPDIKIYTDLSQEEKRKLRAEASVLCPQICSSSRTRNKYYDVSTYLLLAHGVLAPQTRDLFSAGSVGAKKGERGGIYLQRALQDIEAEMLIAFSSLDDNLFEEYWGHIPQKENRISEWLNLADGYATKWKPSESLFLSKRKT